MDHRAVIAQSLHNVMRLYRDIDQLLQLTDRGLKRMGLSVVSGGAVTWDTSTRIDESSDWLYRWFGRAYGRADRPGVVVGLCVHLGAYPEEWERSLARVAPALPAISLSRLELPEELPPAFNRHTLVTMLWAAGWLTTDPEEPKPEDGEIDGAVALGQGARARTLTRFVDYLALRSEQDVEAMLVEPLGRLWRQA